MRERFPAKSTFAKSGLVCGHVSGGEEARLFGPGVASDAALKAAELYVDPLDFRVVPRGDLRDGGDAQLAQPDGELGTDTLQPREIVVRAGCCVSRGREGGFGNGGRRGRRPGETRALRLGGWRVPRAGGLG